MPLISPRIQTRTLSPSELECDLCQRQIYWNGQGRVASIILDITKFLPTGLQDILSLVKTHNSVQSLLLTLNQIPSPYYVLCVYEPSWQEYVLMCNDCWESHLLDLLGCLNKESLDSTRIILTNHETWGKDSGIRIEKDRNPLGWRGTGDEQVGECEGEPDNNSGDSGGSD